MYYSDPTDEWKSIHEEDLWIYNKLILNTRLQHLCGPVGCNVPKSDYYIVRPSINMLGMSRFSRIEWIEKSTDHFHPSEFWCEIFEGDHISIDYYHKQPKLVVLGEKDGIDPLYKWKKWSKIDKNIPFPKILNNLRGEYSWINCEFIGNKLIEVHFRQNPDFRFGNSIAIPIWKDENANKGDNLIFISDEDYLRKGFYIDSRDRNPVKSSDFNQSGEKNDKKS